MIRPATRDDIADLLWLGREMHAESRYAAIAWDDAKVERLLEFLIDGENGLVLVGVLEGEIVGGFLGSCDEFYFSRALVATDYALFVSPDRRGGVMAAQLVKAFTAWALQRGAVPALGITTGVNPASTARLLEAVGFAPVGQLFEFKGK